MIIRHPPSNVTTKDASSDSSYRDNESKSSQDSNEDNTDVPPEYLFPSFVVFVLYRPFVPLSDQLNMNLIDNKDNKKGEGTRAEMRKKDVNKEAIDAKNDSTSTRGFTIDQRIDIESISMQKETMVDRKNEVAMVDLLLEESATTKLIDLEERRAIFHCPEYNTENPY